MNNSNWHHVKHQWDNSVYVLYKCFLHYYSSIQALRWLKIHTLLSTKLQNTHKHKGKQHVNNFQNLIHLFLEVHLHTAQQQSHFKPYVGQNWCEKLREAESEKILCNENFFFISDFKRKMFQLAESVNLGK